MLTPHHFYTAYSAPTEELFLPYINGCGQREMVLLSTTQTLSENIGTGDKLEKKAVEEGST